MCNHATRSYRGLRSRVRWAYANPHGSEGQPFSRATACIQCHGVTGRSQKGGCRPDMDAPNERETTPSTISASVRNRNRCWRFGITYRGINQACQ